MTEQNAENNGDELSDNIIGITAYETEPRKKKDFLPWHKPRKQFVRHKQWVDQIIKMIDEVAPENQMLKYLGLPGDDLLDLRYFHQEICEPKNLQLKFLGFNKGAAENSPEKVELNISLDEVIKLKLIDPLSGVLPDDICKIAEDNSVAWEASQKMGPYDVINIDLCDGFGKHKPDQFQNTHYTTMMKLLTIQAKRANPWLLLLTTRSGPKHIQKDALKTLKDLYLSNIEKCQGFKNSSKDSFAIDNLISLESACKTNSGVSNVFLISLCKWIASILVGQNPPSKMEVKSVLGYKVEERVDHQDLVSIAIRITPTFDYRPDLHGLAKAGGSGPDECTMALQALKRVSKMLDIDAIIKDDPSLLSTLIDMSSALLDEARYDTTTYKDWAKAI